MAATEASGYFDEQARDWDNDPMKTARAQAVAAGIRARVPLSAEMCALEVGCGTGLLSFALQPYLRQITLADSSPGMLAVLQDKIAATGSDNLRPKRFDLSSDPLPQQRYDVITALMTLHHIADTEKTLRDLYALLSNPGYLCIADLDREDGSFHGSDFSGHCGFERAALGQQAIDAGFHRVEFCSIFTIRKGTPEKDFPLFLMVAEKK